MNSVAAPKLRLTELDGLRGWAALSVAMFHLYWESFGALHPEIRNLVTGTLLNGNFAVSLFFVVSGAALSTPYLNGGGRAYVLSAAVRRYVRLALPIMFFAIIFYGLARAGLVVSNQVAPILGREDWSGLTTTNAPSITDTVLFVVREVFTGAVPGRDLLPFLWTMPIEMLGSMLLFLMLAVEDLFPAQRRVWLGMTTLLFVLSPYLGAFFIGARLARMRLEGRQWSLYRRAPGVVTFILVISGFAAAMLTKAGGLPAVVIPAVNVLGAALLVHAALSSPALGWFLGQTRISLFLGRISFVLYILHHIVIMTVLSGLVLEYRDSLDFATCMGIATLCLVICLVLSWATAPVDQASHKISRKFSTLVLGSAKSR
ncbi:MAG: acyltransferase [Pseudomonadota bacterium]